MDGVKPGKYGEKMRACLRIASLEALSIERARQYNQAAARYSEKAIHTKFVDLAGRGYIDYGVSARTGWLTDKGRAALAEIEAAERAPG